MNAARMSATALACCVALACRAEQRASDQASASTGMPQHFSLGRAATAAEIAALDIDVAASGAGLPRGHGDTRQGDVLYRAKCAVCHGANGEGIAPNPALVGREPRAGFPFASDFKLKKTIGNYWPYATTLYDYIRRAMPLLTPGILTNDEVYSLTAYLLAANEVIPTGTTLDSASLVAVRMPARDKFVKDDRKGGTDVKD
jgi:S-disulfanyl-L-cysteine oxidoreductase SoxD